MFRKYSSVTWSIAGLDPAGAAGLLADTKVFAALGVHGVGVATALTAQGLERCVRVFPAAGGEVAEQIEALGPELAPAAVKIGMLGSVEVARVVAAWLERARQNWRKPFVVLDPVLAASSGLSLSEPELAGVIMRELLPQVDLITPNLIEAQALLGQSGEAPALAQAFLGRGARAVLVKGGHAAGKGVVSDYFASGSQSSWLHGERHEWETRGTGCALSAAIAAYSARGEGLFDAVVAARIHLATGVRNAVDLGGKARIIAPGADVNPQDLPWLGAAERAAPFPDCGTEPLGFYPIVDRTAWIRRLVPLGVRTIQLRVKDLSGAALLSEIDEAQRVCSAHGARLFVNDHWRAALTLGAYGVHLGQEDLAEADLPALRRAKVRLGISTHSYEEAARAAAVRPSYVALGPIFPTTLKTMRFGPQGVARIAEWRRLFDVPLVAIGGITLDRAAEIRAQGAAAIAVVSDVTRHPDPEGRVRAWLEEMRA